MRRPHMSTGSWLFAGLIGAALITPAGVYAAVNSHVAIGNIGNSTTASVDAEHQLLTTIVAPNAIVRIHGRTGTYGCTVIYTPTSGKALVLLSVTVLTTSANEVDIAEGAICAHQYDAFLMGANQAQQHTYPAGLPLSRLSLDNTATYAAILATGYLIPASQLPATMPATAHGGPPRR